VGHTRENDIAC